MDRTARGSNVASSASLAGAVRGGLLAGLVAVLAIAAAVAYLRMSGVRLPFERPREVERLLVIGALADENGELVAQVIAEADLARGVVASIEPSTPATIPGTTYASLRDAYPFGGGTGVARALAAVRGGDALPAIALDEAALARVFDSGGRFEVALAEPMSVFDGERLYEFRAGTVTIASVSELRAMLNGAGYLSDGARRQVLRDACAGLVRAAAAYPGGLGAAVEAGLVEGDLTPDEADQAAQRMAGLRGE